MDAKLLQLLCQTAFSQGEVFSLVLKPEESSSKKKMFYCNGNVSQETTDCEIIEETPGSTSSIAAYSKKMYK
jgi:hypothetical protein